MSQFLVLAEDYTDEDALSRRLSVREAHLKRMKEEKAAGHFVVGGAKLNENGNMCGSMLVVQLEDENAVNNWVNKDPYVTGKVWEHITIVPFRVAEV